MTKLIAKNGNMFIKGRNMKVVEKISLGLDKSICMIHIGKIYYVLAVSKQNIELLDKINPKDMEITSNSLQNEKFDDNFDSFLDEYIDNENDYLNKEPKNMDNFTTPMWNKLKEMKRRNEAIKQYIDKEE